MVLLVEDVAVLHGLNSILRDSPDLHSPAFDTSMAVANLTLVLAAKTALSVGVEYRQMLMMLPRRQARKPQKSG